MLFEVTVSRPVHSKAPDLTLYAPEKALLALRPRQSRRLPPNGAVAAHRPLQWQREHLQPQHGGARQVVRGRRGASPLCQVHPAQELVRCWVRRLPVTGVQL